jgi:hypothetical protein
MVLVDACRRASPEAFEWRQPPYEYEYTIPPIDILFGSAALRQTVDSGGDVLALARGSAEAVADFDVLRRAFLLYP